MPFTAKKTGQYSSSCYVLDYRSAPVTAAFLAFIGVLGVGSEAAMCESEEIREEWMEKEAPSSRRSDRGAQTNQWLLYLTLE